MWKEELCDRFFCPSTFICLTTWLITNQFWGKEEYLQSNKFPASSVKLDGWIKDRDARKCPEKGEKRSKFSMSSLPISKWLRTNHSIFYSFSSRAELKAWVEWGGLQRGYVSSQRLPAKVKPHFLSLAARGAACLTWAKECIFPLPCAQNLLKCFVSNWLETFGLQQISGA